MGPVNVRTLESHFAALRAGARRHVAALLAPTLPTASGPLSPAPGRLGASPFWASPRGLAVAETDRDRGRLVGAELPRSLAWLAGDTPGAGPDWEHPSDAAARVIHLAAALPTKPCPEVDRARACVGWHLAWLASRLPPDDVARRVHHLTAIVVGGLLFPDAPAPVVHPLASWSGALAALRFDLPSRVYGDGVLRDTSEADAAEVLWRLALARSACRRNGVPFPAELDAAFVRCARWLERLAGESGELPAWGRRLPAALATAAPLPWTLWNLALAWGLSTGDPAFGAANDPRLRWLGATPPVGAPEPAPKTWAMWSFRDGGQVVAHVRARQAPSTVVVDLGHGGQAAHRATEPLAVSWTLGGRMILFGPTIRVDGAPAAPWTTSVDVARVDGKKAKVAAAHDGWRASGLALRREVRMNQARLLVTDRWSTSNPARHTVRVSWRLGPGWTLDPGAAWTARLEGAALVMQLPEALSWRAAPDADGLLLEGEGVLDATLDTTTSFELR